MPTQKSSGNGKGLLQIHVPTAWVGRNHTTVRWYYTWAVTQIGSKDRQPQTVALLCQSNGSLKCSFAGNATIGIKVNEITLYPPRSPGILGF